MLPNTLKHALAHLFVLKKSTRDNIDSLEHVYVLERNTELSVAAT